MLSVPLALKQHRLMSVGCESKARVSALELEERVHQPRKKIPLLKGTEIKQNDRRA